MSSSSGKTKEQEETATTMSNLALMGDIRRLREMANSQNVNWRDRWGQTPLLRAAWAGESKPNQGHAECARLLLSLGADPDVMDSDGVSALHWTAESENLPVLRLLAESGAHRDSQDKRGLTPLMLASWRGNLKAATELMHLGCDPDIEDNDGDTAASLADLYEHEDIVQLLANWSGPVSGGTYDEDNDASDDDLRGLHKEDASAQAEPRTYRGLTRQRSEVCRREPPAELPQMLTKTWTMQNLQGRLRQYHVTNPQGHCVIINIEKYDDGLLFKSRTGSEQDVKIVEELFTSLKFNVCVRRNLTGVQIYQELCKIALYDHTKYGTFVCFLMAHGTKGAIYGRDGKPQLIKDLVALFGPSKCQGLDRKPKLFFVQACRGCIPMVAQPQGKQQQLCAIEMDGDVPVKDPKFVPNECDFLVCYANTEDSPAYRHQTNGSIFIQTLCAVIKSEYECHDLEDMILEVNNVICSKPIPGNKKNAFYHSVVDRNCRLTKRVSLNPDDA